MERTALMMACERSHREVVHCLLTHGADAGEKMNMEPTALISACEDGNKEVVEFLLTHGAEAGENDEMR